MAESSRYCREPPCCAHSSTGQPSASSCGGRGTRYLHIMNIHCLRIPQRGREWMVSSPISEGFLKTFFWWTMLNKVLGIADYSYILISFTYKLGMLLWCRFSASAKKEWLVPLIIMRFHCIPQQSDKNSPIFFTN